MKTLTTTQTKKPLGNAGRLIAVFAVAMTMVGCQKELTTPVMNTTNNVTVTAPVVVNIQNFRANTTEINLLQGNENIKALGLQWNANTNNGVTYTLEAALLGANNEEFIELTKTDLLNVDITVKDLNKMACQLIPAGQTGMVDLRIRANAGNAAPVYGNPIALKVTTYLPYTEYDLANTFHVIGNFENWNFGNATHLINIHNDGQYEGIVNFDYQYPQFLFVKDEKWNLANTYTNIGDNKIGFGGNYFNAKTGAGIYFLAINTNTNKFIQEKIMTMGLNGTAVKGADATMTLNTDEMTWTTQTTLNAGDFRIRANNANVVTYGKTIVNGYMVPDAAGKDFHIEKAGTYTVTINLRLAGNYQVTVVRNNNVK